MQKEKIRSIDSYDENEIKNIVGGKGLIITVCILGLLDFSTIFEKLFINMGYAFIYNAIVVIWMTVLILFVLVLYRMLLLNKNFFSSLFIPEYLRKMINSGYISNPLSIIYLKYSWAIRGVFAISAPFFWSQQWFFSEYSFVINIYLLINMIVIAIGEICRRCYYKKAVGAGYPNVKEQHKEGLDPLLNKIILVVFIISGLFLIMESL